MSHCATPCEAVSLSPVMIPGLTKGKQTLPLPSDFRLSHTLALPRFGFSPGFPESCAIPNLLLIHAFEMLSTNTPEAETYARILSAFPNHKQARSHKLSEEPRKYYESMASSIISNNHGRMEYAFKLARTPIFHGGVGRSTTHDKSEYDTDARGVDRSKDSTLY